MPDNVCPGCCNEYPEDLAGVVQAVACECVVYCAECWTTPKLDMRCPRCKREGVPTYRLLD